MKFLQTLAEMEGWNGGQGPVQSSAPSPDVMQPPPGKNKTLMHMMYRTQAEEEEVSAQHDEFVKFLQDNPTPSEEEMNAFADQQGLNPDDLDERIYALLSSLLKGVGKHNDSPDDEFDSEQLQKGIEIEMEHTGDELVAKMIAKDHLAEIPDYYDRLGQMEDEAKGDDDEISDTDLGPDEEMDMVDDEMSDEDFNDEEDLDMEEEEEDDMDMRSRYDDEDMGDDEDMDLDMGDDEEFDDEDMGDEDFDDEDFDDDEEDVDPDEVMRLAKDFQRGKISYDEFRSELDALESPEASSDDYDEYDDMGDEEFDDEDMGDETDYESGDLEDDEFEVNMGSAEDVGERPRKDRHVKRLTFKESLLRG